MPVAASLPALHAMCLLVRCIPLYMWVMSSYAVAGGGCYVQVSDSLRKQQCLLPASQVPLAGSGGYGVQVSDRQRESAVHTSQPASQLPLLLRGRAGAW